MTREATIFAVGDKVQKVGGDYTFGGMVVAAFTKLSGQARYVVEDDRGILHIFSAKNLAYRMSQTLCSGCGHDQVYHTIIAPMDVNGCTQCDCREFKEMENRVRA